jgi:hypothetical protein
VESGIVSSNRSGVIDLLSAMFNILIQQSKRNGYCRYASFYLNFDARIKGIVFNSEAMC